jgi:hypothetical protein
LLLALTSAIAGDFTQTLTPENIRAAGLGKLTPAELEQLDGFVQAYAAAASAPHPVPGVAQVAVAEPAPSTPGPNQPVASSVTSPPPSTSKVPSWVGALEKKEQASKQPDKSEALESRLRGDFNGWSGRSTFRLENGQLWKQAGQDTYLFAPTLKSPKVKISPAAFGSFWLEIEGVYQRCRVLPVKL